MGKSANAVNVVFNADTGQFVAGVDAATGAVNKSSQAVAAAKNAIKQSFQEQAQAAKAAGASQQELEALYNRSLMRMASVTDQNANKIITSLQNMAAKQKQIAAQMQYLQMPTGAHTATVSDRMAASASVRALDSGNPGIRAVENFLVSIPGVGAAMKMLFPILGAAGLLGMVADFGKEGYEAFQKVQKSAQELREAYSALHEKSIILIDDKEIENQKIQDQIDKLSGKPNNGLQTALLESKKMADQLVESLQEDRHQLEALFKEHDTGNFGRAMSLLGLAPSSTKQQNDELLKDQKKLTEQIRTAKDKYNDALFSAPDAAGREKATKDYNTAIRSSFQGWIDTYQKESNRLKREQDDAAHNRDFDIAAGGSGKGSDMHADQIANINGRVQQLKDRLRIETLDESIFSGNTHLGGLKQAQDMKRQAKEAQRAADQAQREAWQNEDDKRKLSGNDSAAVEINTWNDRLRGLKQGSEQYLYAQHQLTEKLTEARRQQTEQQKHDNAELKRYNDDWAELVANVAKQDAEADKARNRAGVAKGQQNAAYSEAALAIQQQTGQISRQGAAFQLAQIHAEQYRQQTASLKAELDEQTALNPFSAETVNAQAAIDKAAADRRVQVMQDAANTAATSWETALRNANAVWIQDSQDTAKQVTELYQQTISGLNDNLSDLMVGKKSNFAGMFQGIGKTLANNALQRLEAPLLGAFGKPDGSSSNPFSVKVVDGGFGGGLNSGLSGIGKFFSSDDDDDSKQSSGFFGKAVGFLGGLFGGGRALGGPVLAGVSYDVGEMGRERFVPSQNGTIIPANQMGGGNAYYTVNVANGVTPEQMNMHVQTALQQFHPKVVGSSVAAMKEHQRRQPSSTR